MFISGTWGDLVTVFGPWLFLTPLAVVILLTLGLVGPFAKIALKGTCYYFELKDLFFLWTVSLGLIAFLSYCPFVTFNDGLPDV